MAIDRVFADALENKPPILYEILRSWTPFVVSEIPAMREARANAGSAKPVEYPSEVAVEDRRVPGPVGSPEITLRIIRSREGGSVQPCLYWMHGGGMITGDLRQGLEGLLRWAVVLRCTVVSIDYRLAPEAAFPGPLEDCYAGLHWIWTNAYDLGIDRERLLIGGVSAGGGLAAALAILARDRGEVSVKFQFLLSAMLDDRGQTVSQQFENSPVWSREMNDLAWRAYLGDFAGAEDIPIYASPARATVEQLVGLPRTFIAGGTMDIFRDDMLAYASKLLSAGVDADIHLFSGAPHGFNDVVPDAVKSRRLIQLADDAIDAAMRD